MGGRATIPTKQITENNTLFLESGGFSVSYSFKARLISGKLGLVLIGLLNPRGIQPLLVKQTVNGNSTDFKCLHNMYLLGEGECVTYTSLPPKKGEHLRPHFAAILSTQNPWDKTPGIFT